jgi:hypothetical protein
MQHINISTVIWIRIPHSTFHIPASAFVFVINLPVEDAYGLWTQPAFLLLVFAS